MNAPWKSGLPGNRDPFSAYICDDNALDVIRPVVIELGWQPEKCNKGGLRNAVQSLSVSASPAILLVDLSESGDPLNDINALAEVCEPGTIVIAAGQVNDVRLYRDLVASGRLGRLVSANVMASFYKPQAYFDLAWRREPGGGPVLINLIHEIDMLRFLCGEITQVQALSSNAVRGFAVEDTAAALLRFENGALGTLLLSDTAVAPWCWDFCAGEQDQYPRQDVNTLFFAGTQGSLSLPDLSLWHYRGERSWHAEITREQTVALRADPYTAQLLHFAAVIRGEEAPLCSALDGLRTLQATLAVLEAATAGAPVSCTV